METFEYLSYDESDHHGGLELRAAELIRRLRSAAPPEGIPVYQPPAGPLPMVEVPEFPLDDVPAEFPADDLPPAPEPETDGLTEQLIIRGRHSGRSRRGQARAPRAGVFGPLGSARGLLITGAVLAAFVLALVLLLSGGGASWPASVSQVQAEITVACQNPNVASEPGQVNFACAKETQQVLWVFSLLTSGNDAGYTDGGTGRVGLEPIQPSQGGDIAWSLNLHHPYDPANPNDSLQVAARAINNIIGGATLTNSSGGALVEPGLDSKAANCLRYTGSARLVTHAGYPARCALPVTTPAGQAALVSDVFAQWMAGTPSSLAAEAGVLFENAGNPGDSRVQAILATLPSAGQ